MKKLSLSLICVILHIYNVDALQHNKHGVGGLWKELGDGSNTKTNTRVNASYKQEKGPKLPDSILPKRSKKTVTTGNARLTDKENRTGCNKTLVMATQLPEIVEKSFSINVYPLKFDKFSVNDIGSIVNPKKVEYPYLYLKHACTINSVIDNGTECLIPYGYTHTSTEFMSNNINLVTVKMVESVRFIGEKSFYNCVNLSNVEILGTPNLLYIGDQSFENTGLKKVVLPYGVKHIGSGAFACCKFLEEIHIPSSVSDIGFNVANGCVNLKDVFLPHNAIISLNKIHDNSLYIFYLRFTGVSEGFYNPIGSFLNLNIHRKNADGSYTNVSIYRDTIAYCNDNICRNALLDFDSKTKSRTLTF